MPPALEQNLAHPQVAEGPVGYAFSGDGTLVVPLVGGTGISHDLGKTWIEASEPGLYLTGIAADPTTGSRLYACASTDMGQFDVSVSEDDGMTWTQHPGGGAGLCLEVAVQPGTGALFEATSTGLYKSTDEGASFVKVAPLVTGSGGEDLAFDPRHPNIVFISASRGSQDGIYRSVNSGATWQPDNPVRNMRQYGCGFGHLAVSGAGTVLVMTDACGGDQGRPGSLIYASVNRGATWRGVRLPPYPRAAAARGWGWSFFVEEGDPHQTVVPDGKRFVLFSSSLLSGAFPAPAPLWATTARSSFRFAWLGSWSGG